MSGIDILRAQRLGGQVWRARDSAGVKPEVLAQRIGISLTEVPELENGTHPRTVTNFTRNLN